MKLAKVVQIFKQGSRFVCNNYRPISVLSSISKIFEKCIFNQLMFYFTNNKTISPKQYGFRPGFTTSDCLIDLIEEITSSLDQGHYVVSLFLDLRTFAPIATAHLFAHVTHTSCIADHEGKHDAKGANIFHKNGT